MTQRRSRGRKISGIVLLDKRPGISSNGALQEVKRLFQARKAGHTGSLDPLASGLLPLCFGDATKVSAFLLNTEKCYEVVIRLGVATVTGDAEGEVCSRQPVPSLTAERVERILEGFHGEIMQVPPMYSALKHEGKRLYELARAGLEVERPPRPVTILALSLLDLAGDCLKLWVHCSKGTYVRTLAEDIATALGSCGHVEALRRTRVGDFELADAWRFEQLQALTPEQACQQALLPIDQALAAWPRLSLSNDMVFFIRQGQAVLSPKAPKSGWVRLYGEETFLGIGEILADGRVAPRRLLAGV